MCKPILKKEMPTIPGWYWCYKLNGKYEDATPQILYVRNYAGKLAIGNAFIESMRDRYMWSDPLPIPDVPTE